MKFAVGQVFRVPPRSRDGDASSPFPNLRTVTRGRHARGLDIQRGMFFFQSVSAPDGKVRRPAFIFDSNNLDKSREDNPWLDVIEPDRGYALYHGDNRRAGRPPLEARGNQQLTQTLEQYVDEDLREFAPPILLFEHVAVEGRMKGYRRFAGFGLPTDIRIQTQASSAGHFTNLAIELTLLGLEAEHGLFNWAWIDARRDSTLTASQANQLAPKSWREWVRHGDRVLNRVRRNVLRSRVVRPVEQRPADPTSRSILQDVYRYFEARPHGFEGLASLVTKRVLGENCERGWITKRAGDGGIDFVSRLSIGDGFSSASLVVLGQAKLRSPEGAPISGEELSRVVARLRRGWLGAFVTTGTFSMNAQEELATDEYPIVLINGDRLALELQKELRETGLSLRALLDRETDWYEKNLSSLPPEHVVKDLRSGQPIWPEAPHAS
jgi:hypothetical protein